MLIPLTVVLCLGSSVSAKICEDNSYWSTLRGKCAKCTTCTGPEVVITPCQSNRDTRCGPLSDLNIDWSWMKHGDKDSSKEKEMTDTFKENMKEISLHEKHVKEKQNFLKELQNKHKLSAESLESNEEDYSEDIFRRTSKEKAWNKFHDLRGFRPKGHVANEFTDYHKARMVSEDPKIIDIPIPDSRTWDSPHFTKEEAAELLQKAPKVDALTGDPYNENRLEFDEDGIIKKSFGMYPVDDSDDGLEDIRETDMGQFSPTEKFVLDWQTVVLAMAVASCFTFFLVIACYSLSYLRNWKSYIGKDVEELQAWLAPKKNTQRPSTIYKTTTEVIHKDSGRHCKYLERIITKNAKKFNRVPGNVYQGAHPSIETRPLTAGDPTVHKTISI